MSSIELPTLNDVHALPADGPIRDRGLQRLVDARGASEALAALKAASISTDGGLSAALASAEAVLRGGEDASRDRLAAAVIAPEFLALLPPLIHDLRKAASSRPESGGCTVASALDVWLWTAKHFVGTRLSGVDELAEAVAPLLAARCLALDVAEPGLRADLSHTYAARVSSAAGATCAELVFGYRKHLGWDAEGCATCFAADDVDDLEAIMPGIATGARMRSSVVESDGSHPAKAGPCARLDGVETFAQLRSKLDGCLTGARIAKARAAAALAAIKTNEGNA